MFLIVVISFSLLTIVSCGATFSTITVYFLGGRSIRGLAKLHADQDRLGGLLAQYLSEGKGGISPLNNVGPLLQEIESLQISIAKLVLEQARSL